MFQKTISRFFGCLLLSQMGQVDAFCDPYIYNPTDDSTSFSVKAEYLLLSCNERLPWIGELNGGVNPTTDRPFIKAQGKQLTMDWSSGFRVGLGVNLPCQWALKADWTTFQTQTRRHESGNLENGTVVFPAFSFLSSDLFETSDYRFHNSYNYNDLLLYLNRDFEINGFLTLSPKVGVKALFTRQISRFDFTFSSLTPYLLAENATQHFSSPHNFWSVGGFASLETFWSLIWGLEVDAEFGLSLLPGRHKVTLDDNYTGIFLPATSTNRTFDELDYTLDGTLALVWSTPCNQNRGQIRLKAGCEGHYISDQTKFPDTVNRVNLNSRPLTLLGFVFGVYVEI